MPFGSIASDRLRNINYERMRAYRLERTKQMMEEDGLDAIITWEPWDIRYIASAYVPMATRWGGQQFVVLPRNGEPHLFSYTCYATEALQEEMPWLNGPGLGRAGGREIRHQAGTDRYISPARVRHPGGVRHHLRPDRPGCLPQLRRLRRGASRAGFPSPTRCSPCSRPA